MLRSAAILAAKIKAGWKPALRPRSAAILAALLPAALFLSGCAGDQRNRQVFEHAAGATGLAVETGASLRSAPADSLSSENALQNSLTGIGLQVAKVAEKVQGFGGDLAHVEASLASKIEAQVNAQAELRAQLSSQIRAEISASLQAQLESNAQVLAALNTQVQAQAGLRNSIEQTAQTVNAARDANVQTIQFSQGMQEVMERSYKTHGYVVYVFCGALVAIVGILQERSRARAERRHRELFEMFSGGTGGSPVISSGRRPPMGEKNS